MSINKFEVKKWYKVKETGIIGRCSAFDDPDTVYFDPVFWDNSKKKDPNPYLKAMQSYNLKKGYPFSEDCLKSYECIDLTKSDFLTTWEQIQVLKRGKRAFMRKRRYKGLCFILYHSLSKNHEDLIITMMECGYDLIDVFPLFRSEIAKSICPTSLTTDLDYWWDVGTDDGDQCRVNFLTWMINTLRKELTPWQRFWSKIL